MSARLSVLSRLRPTASLALCLAAGCSSLYYSAWEQLGKQKKDLLRDHVIAARDDQVEASGEFKDALTVLRESYPLEASTLQKTYDRLKGEYDDAKAGAEALERRTDKVRRVAQDLFAEWATEAKQITEPSLRSASLRGLEDTKRRYEVMKDELVRAHDRMEPVLVKFNDHVLYLKHSLNAQAVGALRAEATRIESSIEDLIADMNRSIAETDRFISTLSS